MAHSNKHIRAAIEYAEQMGWRFQKSGPRAHVYGQLFCSNNCMCIVRVFSTPRSPENHAKNIVREINKCPR